jgi:Peptidase family M28
MLEQSLIPAEDTIYNWIQAVFDQGIRRPGYPADNWATEFARDRFAEFGLENVRLEPVQLPFWDPGTWFLHAWPEGDKSASFEIKCFPLPHSAPAPGLESELAAYDPTQPAAVADKIALYDVPLMRMPHKVLAGLASWHYDPYDTYADASQVFPFGREIMNVMEPAAGAGAVGFIGTLIGYPSNSCDYYVPYDAVARPIPGVWASGSDGDRLRKMLANGPVRVRLEIDSRRETITTHNVIGELPGADEDIVIIGSHHDGPWSSAVEDGSGIALVLAQARYWSQVTASERPHRLVFLLNSGHMAGGAGTKAFIASHPDELARTVLEIHLEHTANECKEADGKLVPTGLPESRWWFTSRNPELEQAVRTVIESEEMARSLIMPPTAFGDRPTTDGGDFHLAGVPIVNYLAAPFYLFDSQDTMDKIHRPSLLPLTRAAIRLVEWTAGRPAASLRAPIAVP